MRLFCGLVYVLVLMGCSSVSFREVAQEYYNGDSKKAFELSKKNTKSKTDSLLYFMMGGIVGFDLSLSQSLSLLESAEKEINLNEQKGILTEILGSIGAVAVNDNVLPYRGYLYEGVMVNYYKALLYMQSGDLSNARVEFNRANDRQRRIKDYYQAQIKKASKIQKENRDSNPTEEERILKSYSNLSQFASFDGYINPVISYVSGLFFMLEGDSKGVDLLKEAYGISRARVVQDDLIMAQKGGVKTKYTWVIIEDGRSASKIERSFTLPILTPETILSVSLALPDLKKGKDFGRNYELSLANQSIDAQRITSLNGVIFNEFSKHLPFIVTRSVISTTTKTLSQYFLQKSVSGFAKVFVAFGGMAYSIASTRADLRSNVLLPNSFWVARIENAQGKLILRDQNRVFFTIAMDSLCQSKGELCVNKNNIIYLRNAGKNVFYHILLEH